MRKISKVTVMTLFAAAAAPSSLSAHGGHAGPHEGLLGVFHLVPGLELAVLVLAVFGLGAAGMMIRDRLSAPGERRGRAPRP